MFDLQTAIDKQQQLVISLQTKAANGIEGATAELAQAIAGLRDLQAMANNRPKSPNAPVFDPEIPKPPYTVR